MNPFQRARDEANQVRATLLGNRAAESVSAIELLKAVETKLKIAIEPVDPGYHALAGATAVLKRDERHIYVSNDVDTDKHAALAAHELGHWFLDADKTPTTVAYLKSISGHPGSPAIVTVEAYGARERQELQANVFSRELLVPRDLAQKLFRQGKGPRAAASEIGVPIEYIRQQMLDALLLPTSKPEGTKPLHVASDDQRAAAEATERFAYVVAGPGTGKTSTLIHRVKHLIEKQKVDPAHILVLTFTNKAAFELVERLRSAGIARAADIWAGTFHAFGLEFLRKYHQRFDLDPDLNVADLLNSMTMLAAALPSVSLQHYLRVQDPYDWLYPVVGAIKRLKEELVSPEQYRARLQTLTANSDDLRKRRLDVATLYELHEAQLAKSRQVDFVDLVAKPALAIRADRAPFSELADKFQYVLVDEYQDVTRAMIELMRQLAIKAKSLWVVGDVRQAIHHWRGASVQSLIVFDKTFKNESGTSKIQRYPLARNRRSSEEVLDLIEQIGKHHVLETMLPLDKMTSEMGKTNLMPGVVTSNLRAAMPIAVESAINHCRESGVKYGDQTVLARGSVDRDFVAAHLSSRDVPLLFIGELAQRVEIKRCLCLMQLLVERQPKALIGLLTAPGLAVPQRDIEKLLAATQVDLRWQRGRWIEAPPPGLSYEGLNVVAKIRQLLQGQSRFSNPWDFVCDLLFEKRFGIPDLADVSISAWMVRIALWQFAYSVRSGDGDRKQARLPRFLLRQRLRQRIGDTNSERELPPEAAALDAVRIQTIHGSKGLEYDAVHLYRVNGGSFGRDKPSWQHPEAVLELAPPEVLGSSGKEYDFEQAVERNNLLYVAVSRAKRHLWLYQDDEFGTNDHAPQLGHYPAKYKSYSFKASEVTPAAPAAASASSATAVPLSFNRFEVFARCPLQYAYRYEFNLRREEDTDPARRAQSAIMKALGEVAKTNSKTPQAHLDAAWADQFLPEKSLDPSLWADALFAFNRGLAQISSWKLRGGVFAELGSTAANLAIALPWAIRITEKYSTAFHILRFSSYGLAESAKLLKPMLPGMPNQGAIVLHSLVPQTELAVVPARAIAKTDGFKAAVRFQEGNRGATRGRVCSRCAFLTICPQTPM
jgi:superfamily I DNA/RNA helicase